MPRKAKGADPYQRICRNCQFFEPRDDAPDEGQCFWFPPTVIAVEGEVGFARPMVDADDRACAGFQQRLNS